MTDTKELKQDLNRSITVRTFFVLFSNKKQREIPPKRYFKLAEYRIRLIWNLFPGRYPYIYLRRKSLRLLDSLPKDSPAMVKWHVTYGVIRITTKGVITDTVYDHPPQFLTAEVDRMFTAVDFYEDAKYDSILWEK